MQAGAAACVIRPSPSARDGEVPVRRSCRPVGRDRKADGPVARAARARVTVIQVEASRGRPRATGRRGDGDVLAPRRPTELREVGETLKVQAGAAAWSHGHRLASNGQVPVREDCPHWPRSEKPTVPLPVPLAPESTVIQATFSWPSTCSRSSR